MGKSIRHEFRKIMDNCSRDKQKLMEENEKLHLKLDNLLLRQEKKEKIDSRLLKLKILLVIVLALMFFLGYIDREGMSIILYLLGVQ